MPQNKAAVLLIPVWRGIATTGGNAIVLKELTKRSNIHVQALGLEYIS